LQHAYNPVHWYPWGEEALQKSIDQQKPIILSIGYSACHWCHVMEKECFEDNEVAEVMNANFVCIKVDREERPDIDRLYMEAVQTITGAGGWPLNVFLTPEKKPFYGGTYYPKFSRYNRPGWLDVLQYFSDIWKNKRELIENQSEQLLQELKKQQEHIRQGMMKDDSEAFPDFLACRDKILQKVDTVHGGFGNAPKFPQFGSISFLYTYSFFSNDPVSLHHAKFAADALISGGIFDHVGGGMARYSTDDAWLVPHFEKMLYDNALLIEVLSDLYSITQENRYKRAIHKTIDFCERELLSPEGLFYAALDADSEGEEGKYYVYSKKEIEEVLGEDGESFCKIMGVTETGNFEGRNILSLSYANSQDSPLVDVDEKLDEQLEKLRLYRNNRIKPGLDDKQILSWNALMNRSLSRAYASLGDEKYRKMAIEHGLAMERIFVESGQVNHRIFCKGKKAITPMLEDLSYLISAFIGLQEISGNQEYLIKAAKWMEQIENEYTDGKVGPYFNAVSTKSDNFFSAVVFYDAEIPSANAFMAENLYKLGVLLGKEQWKERSAQMQKGMRKNTATHPSSYSKWLNIDFHSHVGKKEIVITGEVADNCLQANLRRFQPNCILQSSKKWVDMPLFLGKKFDQDAWIYKCLEGFCAEPEKFLE
jgi:uncharacterized protein YyaL (SSP411 family)